MRRQLTENFYQDEFDCPCCGKNNIHMDIVLLLQKLRTAWGKPVKITSGTRCEKHNALVKGKRLSDHVMGLAVDIDVYNALDRRELVRLALSPEIDIPTIGVKKDALHLSIGKPARIFTYDT